MTNKIRPLMTCVSFAFCFSIASTVCASNTNLKSRFQNKINQFKLESSDLGLVVADIRSGEPFYELNSKKKFIPASITKLVTAAAVLDAFPAGTKFQTQIWTQGRQQGSVLKGDVYLKGGGDPSFVSETMWFLVNEFFRTGIKDIEGDLYVDDFIFEQTRFDSSRQSQRVDRAYDAPTGGMSFNWNTVNVYVRPGEKAGDPARVYLDPENDYTELKAQVKTVKSGQKSGVEVDRRPKSTEPGDVIIVNGQIAVGSSEVTVYTNITQPDYWSGYQLKSFLEQRGIRVKGKVKKGKTPKSAELAANAPSKPIEHILADMNKFSNNYVAEMLSMNLAVKRGQPGTVQNGMTEILKFMDRMGLDRKSYDLFNPSGLTRDNEFSADMMLKLLKQFAGEFRYFPEFANSLPIAGVDGTMRNRLKGTAGERWVRAKTGYINNVVSLAGYAGQKDGSIYPFVFIYNGKADESKVRQFYDQLLLILVE